MYTNHDFVHRANCLAYSHTSAFECQTVVTITWLRPLFSAQSASWTLVSQSYCLMFLPPTQHWCCSSSMAKLMNGNSHVLCEHNKSFYHSFRKNLELTCSVALFPGSPYCKRRKAGQGLGTRLHVWYSWVIKCWHPSSLQEVTQWISSDLICASQRF